jgi:hypothetical protein
MGGSLDALFGLPRGGTLAASFRVHLAQLVYTALLRLGGSFPVLCVKRSA